MNLNGKRARKLEIDFKQETQRHRQTYGVGGERESEKEGEEG